MTQPTDHLNPPPVVLIIDDNPENRLLLSSQLNTSQCRSLQAGGGLEGIEMARLHDPDIILLDVMMPDMNGFEVCKALKDNPETHLIPVIMITALREVQYRIQGIEAGADEFLSRPHVREELLVRVRTLSQLKRARVRLEEERNRLQLLYNLSRSITRELDIKSTMAEVITQTQAALGATKGNIMLLNEEGEVNYKFLIRAGSTLEISDQVTQDVMTRGLGGWLVQNNQGDIINDISQDARWVTLPDHQPEMGSAIGVPLSSAKRVLGIMILNHPTLNYFTHEHLALLETIAAQAVIAIENASLFTQVKEERGKLEAILAQSKDAIITTDEEQVVALFNGAAEEVFGVAAEFVAGLPVYEVAELVNIAPVFEEAQHGPSFGEVELDNGRFLYVSVSPIHGVGYTAVIQDVTEMKRIEQFKLDQERGEKERVKDIFSTYMGPRLVEHLLQHAPGLMARRERRRAVVMFADLRNWTGGMITKLDPSEAIEQLNEFFTNMMEIALEHDGTVFELTGDEMLVGFNAPFDQPNAPVLALKTAWTMQTRFNDLQRKWYDKAGTEIGLGIGIAMGEVLVGNVGANTRMSFRMVGETMNKAARLVDLAEDGQIIMSDSVYRDLQPNLTQLPQQMTFAQLDAIRLKGIVQPQTLYRVQITRTPLGARAA